MKLSAISHQLSALIFVLLTACGYQFRLEGAGPVIGGPSSAVSKGEAGPRLAVLNFENKTFEPNLELKYTTYTRREFAAGSGALVVNDSEPADLVLKGQILSVVLPSLTFSQTITAESRVTVTVRAVVEDARTRKMLWEQKATASSEFFITNDLQFNRVLQTRALEQAGRLIAEDLATRFLLFLDTAARSKQPENSGSGSPVPKSPP